MAAGDLLFQNWSTIQNGSQPTPATLASAATVAPVTYITLITGTVAIATVTVPFGAPNGTHQLIFIFTTTTPVAFTTTGNVKAVVTPTQFVPVILIFNPLDLKYYPK